MLIAPLAEEGPMKITAQEEYGLRCLLCVVEDGREEPLSAGDIAEREGLSLPYAQKLLRELSKTGMVEAKRGKNGGYILARPADAISLGDVMRQLGGMLEIERFCEEHTGNRDVCTHDCNCSIRPVWTHVSEFLMETMDNIPLSLLIEREEEVEEFLDQLDPPEATPDATVEEVAG
ncbi:MAG: Rrf2 family transcriptional regulator [Bradymonadaceae bacterium]